MNFNDITEHIITLYNNSNKLIYDNELNLQDNDLSASDTKAVRKAIKENPEQIALKAYLAGLDEETLQKLCTVADYAVDGEKDFNSLAELNSTLNKAACLEKLHKKVQYIPEAKRLLEHDKIEII